MDQHDAIKILTRLAGPATPFFALEDMDRERSDLVANADRELENVLFGILENPPDARILQQASREDFNMELNDILAKIGRKDPQRFLQRLGPFLEIRHARTAVIEIIGSLADRRGVALLAPLIENGNLTDDDLIAIACTLGEIGSEDAAGMLDKMKLIYCQRGVAVRKEIDIALQGFVKTS